MLFRQIVRGSLVAILGAIGGYAAQTFGAPYPIITAALITAFSVEVAWPNIGR